MIAHGLLELAAESRGVHEEPRDQHPERLREEAQQKVEAERRIAVFVGRGVGHDRLRLGSARSGKRAVEEQADEQHHFAGSKMGDPQGSHAGERQRSLQHANAAELVGQPAEEERTQDAPHTDRGNEDPDGQLRVAEIVRQVWREVDLVHPAVTAGAADHEHTGDE